MNTTADTDQTRYGIWAPIIRWFRKNIVAEDPHPEPSTLDLLDQPTREALARLSDASERATTRECAVDAPDLLEPTGVDITRDHLRNVDVVTFRPEFRHLPLHTHLHERMSSDPRVKSRPLYDHLHDLGELTDEQYQALAGIADGSTWTPPAPPSHETRPLPRREPIDVTDTLTPGGKALARQRTEQMTEVAERMLPRLARLHDAILTAPSVAPERSAAAQAYRTALRTRIEAERTAREHGRSARRTGSDTHALAGAFAMLDRRDLAADTRAHLAAIVLAEYTGEVAA